MYPWRGDTPVGKKREHTRWYGWQTLSVDGASLAVLIGGASADAGAIAGIGALGAVAGAPVVHVIHDRPGAAVGSLGLRLALPIIGAAVGAGAANCSKDHEMFCGLGEVAVGFMIGATAAVVIDASVLAHETVVDEEPVPSWTLRVSPVVDPNRRMGAITASGVF
jgi:hypothetical protein